MDDAYKTLQNKLEEHLTSREMLRKFGLQKKEMLRLLHKTSFRSGLKAMLPKEEYTCAEVLEACREIMEQMSPEPENGWLHFLFEDGKHTLYPQNFPDVMEPCYEEGKVFFLEVLRICLCTERDLHGFRMFLHFALATDEEQAECPVREEYAKFLDFCRNTYFLEFMRIAAEITPFNTQGHIAGVHNVAMHMARQLKKCGAPVDLALMSGAAIGHDIGKFGCKDTESRRVPYLHYYYTDQLFKRFDMPTIGYIGANHSTWDLELENLSLESLLLIYADFRVKSTRENGVEVIHCYTLKESFQVILDKLDNVDDAKRKRYQKVYSKLRDFENYMIRLGVHTDFSSDTPDPMPVKDSSLLHDREIVDEYKHITISHNVQLMNILSHEASFANILEAARSEKDWKHTRTFLSIIREYNTYLNQRQKLLTISFLYELLMHRESDIRSAAATIMGEIIVGYDTEYRKEIPEGMMAFLQVSSSLEQFEKYVTMILNPDHKLTEQHRMWLGYKLETLVNSVLKNCKPSKRLDYLQILHRQYQDWNRDTFTSFIMLEAIERVPIDDMTPEMLESALQFTLHVSSSDRPEVQVETLLVILRILRHFPSSGMAQDYCLQILDRIPDSPRISILYIKKMIGERLHLPASRMAEFDLPKDVSGSINEAFLENLKAGTHWVSKMVNIHYLYDRMVDGSNTQPVHTTTHLVNLLSGTECGDVRHLSGRMLVQMIELVGHEQRNEVVIELLKGLELGEAEYAKNIPRYLGELIVHLKPDEVDEAIATLADQLITGLDQTACVALDTVGYLLQHYNDYKLREPEDQLHDIRMRKLLGLVLRGMAHYHSMVSQEACYVMGEFIYGSDRLPLQEKCRIYRYIAKKALHILRNTQEDVLSFLIDAAALNSVYRFLSEYILEFGEITFAEAKRAAFFPGTFDPFSLSHRGIVQEIRKQGFQVYLAIDEFSWSKRTQPPLIRRRIAAMSTAEFPDVYMFPSDSPVNIANPQDLKALKELLADKEIYIVEGTDVTAHASAYRKEPQENSIHHFNHILFRRHGEEYELESGDSLQEASGIQGDIIELSLPLYLEDISSTRIRENIDLNRDISHLIDPMVQNYIYDNSLYMREPQYKDVLFTRSIGCDVLDDDEITPDIWKELVSTVLKNKSNTDQILENVHQERLSLAILRNHEMGGVPIAVAIAGRVNSADLMEEFNDLKMVKKIREIAWGKLMVIKGIYGFRASERYDYVQIVLTELLAHVLSLEYTYCLYHGIPSMEERREEVEELLSRQGFIKLSENSAADTVMGVDIHCPIVLTKNMETVLKEPMNTNPRVREVLDQTHRRLQAALTRIHPGNLVISFDSTIMYHKLVEKITQINHVPVKPTVPRQLGEKMCVPFGKVLRGSITPNTVTKALHTEKVFSSDMRSFTIEEYPNYTPLTTQMKTIRSFGRDVILVDDLLHKGYRLVEMSKLFPEASISVDRILVGVMTANGNDLVRQLGFRTDCAYYIPNISSWFVESSMYPFIGGDSVSTEGQKTAGLLTSVNLILPYVTPAFLANENIRAVYELSMVCLENARDILKILEKEYQLAFERNLSLSRLNEVILSPTCPDKGRFMSYDPNVPASYYIENDIQQLGRLEYFTSMELIARDLHAMHAD